HLRALAALGHEVAAVVTSSQQDDILPLALLTPARNPSAHWLYQYAKRERPARAWRLAQTATAVKRWSPDVVHFEWNSLAASHLPLLREGLPSVVSCRGSQIQVAQHNPTRSGQSARILEAMKIASLVHCVSLDMMKSVERLGVSLTKCNVITPAVDPDAYRGRSDRRGALRVCVIGSLIPRKGLDFLVLAISILRDRGVPVRLSVAGDGPERARLDATVSDLGLQSHVEFVGRISSEQVAKLMAQSNCFALPSLAEGIANVALEAMASSLPVVSTNCNGMPEAVVHGETGFLVPIADPIAMANALQLLTDETMRKRMGDAGRARIF